MAELKGLERRRQVAWHQRLVRRKEPSAYLHAWRYLGWTGGVVYGVYCDRLEWLSSNCHSGMEAWRLAAQAVGEPV